MRPRRTIKDLVQLREPNFFETLAVGLQLLVEHVQRLWNGASVFRESHNSHAARVLTTVAEEEAAKVFILLDAVRCPRCPPKRFSRQLGYFNSHLGRDYMPWRMR